LAVNPESFEPGTPQTVLFARVKEHLARKPFVPFRIVTSSGRAYDVPTPDHAALFPILRMIYLRMILAVQSISTRFMLPPWRH
jgi:hypothetical protein